MNKKLSIIIIIVIAAAIVWFYKNKKSEEALAPAPAANLAEVVNEVESIDVGDVDKEFQGIDQELNGL